MNKLYFIAIIMVAQSLFAQAGSLERILSSSIKPNKHFHCEPIKSDDLERAEPINWREKERLTPLTTSISYCKNLIAIRRLPGKESAPATAETMDRMSASPLKESYIEILDDSGHYLSTYPLSGEVAGKSEIQFSPDCTKIMIGNWGNTYFLDLEQKSLAKNSFSGLPPIKWINNNEISYKCGEKSVCIYDFKLNNKTKKYTHDDDIDTYLVDEDSLYISSSSNGVSKVFLIDSEGTKKLVYKPRLDKKHSFLKGNTGAISSIAPYKNKLLIRENTGNAAIGFIYHLYDPVSEKEELSWLGYDGVRAGENFFFSELDSGVHDRLTKINLENGSFKKVSSEKSIGVIEPSLIKTNGEKILYTHDNFLTTGNLVLLEGEKSKELTSDFDQREMAKLKQVDFVSTENLKLPGYLLTPKNEEPKSIILYLHGGSFNFGSVSLDYNNPIHLSLVEAGHGVYSFHTAGDFTKETSRIREYRSEQEYGVNEINDIMLAYDKMKALHPDKKIFLMGFSHGSYLTNLVATKAGDKRDFAGFLSFNGVWDLEEDTGYLGSRKNKKIYIDTDGELRSGIYDIEGKGKQLKGAHTIESAKREMRKIIKEDPSIKYLEFDLGDKYYKARSPLLNADKVTKPLLISHGKFDSSVPFSQFKKAEKALKGKNVTTLSFSDEGHGVFLSKNWKKWQNTVLPFIENNLK